MFSLTKFNLIVIFSLVCVNISTAKKKFSASDVNSEQLETEIIPQINIIKRKYSPSTNQLSFEAECRIPYHKSLTRDTFTWYIRNIFPELGVRPKDINVPTREIKTIGKEFVGYISMKFTVEVQEVMLYCSADSRNGLNVIHNEVLLFRFSNHQVVNTVVFSNLELDIVQQVDVRIKTKESFNVLWKIDDAILSPGDKQDDIEVLPPETSGKKDYKVPLLFSPLKKSDVTRKYVLMLDFVQSGDSAHYMIEIQGKVYNDLFKGTLLPFIIGLSIGILIITVIVITWISCCRKSKKSTVIEQKPDGIKRDLIINNINNVNKAPEFVDKCLDKELNLLDPSENKEQYYSLPFARGMKNDENAIETFGSHYQNIRCYQNTAE